MAWPPWSQRDPQGIAHYVTPEARDWLTLGKSRFDLGDNRLRQVEAIYDALVEAGVQYEVEEYNPSAVLQPIREPWEILRQPKVGTCLDLAVLFSGLCMGNRLLPILVVLSDHALALVSLANGLEDWDGYRPERAWFDEAPIEDAERFAQVVALVDSGDYVAVECTGFAHSAKLAQLDRAEFPETVGRRNGVLPFERAIAAGREQLSLPQRTLKFAVDVAVAQYAWRLEPLTQPVEQPHGLPTPREAPSPPPAWVDRKTEVEELKRSLLDGSGDVVSVVHGMAGVGKSAVAQKLAADPDVEQHFSDGTFWFDLRVSTVDAVLEHIALAFGHSLAGHPVLESRAALVRSIVKNKRLLVVLDGVDDSSSVSHLCPSAPSAALVTTIDRGLAFSVSGHVVHVTPLPAPDALQLIEGLLGDRLPPRKKTVLSRLVTLLGRLPLAHELAARLMRQQLESGWGSVDDVATALEQDAARLGLGLKDRRIRLIFDSTYGRALDQTRREYFARLGAFGPGDLPLDAIAAAWALPVAQARPPLDELVSLSLVDQTGPSSFTLSPLLRDYAVEHFTKLEPSVQVGTHRRAADYYRRWIRDYKETQQQQTLCWYRFERPEWQENERRLLFHLSHLPERDGARLAFTRLYFDAFWWWGSYVRFEYCDQLLEDWGATSTDPDDRSWYDVLVRFARSYPMGADKRISGDWPAVEQALVELRRLAGVDRDVSQLDDERRHIGAITGLFLAQSSRYLGDGKGADHRYREATGILADGCEWWDLAWTLFDWADLHVELKQPERADQAWAEAMRTSVEHGLRDIELRANLYRIEGDVAWAKGDVSSAIDRYCRATFYAYRFQASPHPPDTYTLTFYREITGRVEARVRELVTGGDQTAVGAAITRLREFWSPYWSSGPGPEPVRVAADDAGSPLVGHVLPDEPCEKKLTARSVRYARAFVDEVERRTRAMAPALDAQAWTVPVG